MNKPYRSGGLWVPAILVILSGSSAGLFVYAVSAAWNRASFFDTRMIFALEAGIAAFLFIWWAYSAAAARSLEKDFKTVLRADSISYLSALVLLSYLYLSQFPTLISRYYLVRFLPVLFVAIFLAIKVLTYVSLRFDSLKFTALVCLSLLAAIIKAAASKGPILGEIYSIGFIFWWQFFLAVIFLAWKSMSYFARGRRLGGVICAGLLIVCIGIAVRYSREKPVAAPTLQSLLSALPACPPFKIFSGNDKLVYRRVDIGGQSRDALLLPPPGEAVADMKTNVGTALRVGMGILPKAWDQPGDGVNFIVEISADGEPAQRVFELYLDPKGYPKDRRWVDGKIDLTQFEGRDITITFRTEGGPQVKEPFSRKPDLRYDYAVWSEPELISGKQDRPNIVLILVDTLRRDHLGTYGYRRNVSPNIDALAAQGVVFENAISQSPWTLPSVATVFTSLYPSETGLTTISNPFLEDQLVTLAEVLAGAGYETEAVSSVPIISEQFGFGQGFKVFDESCFSSLDINSAECVTDAAIDRVSNSSSPYFMYLHYYDVHAPYRAPVPFRNIFDPGYTTKNRYLRLGEAQFFNQQIEFTGHAALNDRELKHLVALYDGEIGYVDEQLGRLFERIREAGDNTVIVLISDHGEEFLEHGRFWHGHSLYAELLNVPFIIRLPGSADMGKRVESVVRLIDIMPTLAGLAGTDLPGGVRGKNVLPLIEGDLQARPAFGEVFTTHNIRSLRIGNVKYIRGMNIIDGKGSEMLFDLNYDPGEMHDVAGSEPELTKKMAQLLDELLKTLRPPPAATREADRKMQERLRSLGYISEKKKKAP